MPNPTIPAAGGAMPAEGPRAAAVFGANEITAATCSLVREADEGRRGHIDRDPSKTLSRWNEP
jgi:hypothetical protein